MAEALLGLLVLEEPPVVELPLLPALLFPPAGALGVNVAEGSEMQELAAALAAEADVGALALTVPFPAKLHACWFLFL